MYMVLINHNEPVYGSQTWLESGMIMDNGDASIYVGWTGVRQVEIGKHGGPLGNLPTSYAGCVRRVIMEQCVFFPANHGRWLPWSKWIT